MHSALQEDVLGPHFIYKPSLFPARSVFLPTLVTLLCREVFVHGDLHLSVVPRVFVLLFGNACLLLIGSKHPFDVCRETTAPS